ncbi:unnamed protein product [Euphydryas editha]|uniref:Ig-like domain-containing protein n=1 Tax=Euphydryas editha TaxID=104508 RepID=A0AAU9UVG1_EUPED|nr:unnamed protein product [Euphydryas editha]
MDVPWEVRVQPTHGVSGGSALMTCAASAPVRNHITVTRWFKDGTVLAPMAADAGGWKHRIKFLFSINKKAKSDHILYNKHLDKISQLK